MSANMSLVMHFLFIVSVATLGLGVICTFIARPFLQWSNRFDPRSRLFLIRLFAAWPLFGGLAIGVMVLLPSFSHASKLPFDHCHNPGGCLIQPVAHMLTMGEFAIVIMLLGLLARASLSAFLQWRRSCALTEQINTASYATPVPGVRLIETTSPLAFSVGLFRSIAVLSTGLVRTLTPQQLDIICVHEQTHLSHRDNEYKWALRVLCAFHWPRIKKVILSEHAITLELRADQQVAHHIQDPIAVAETIVAVQRLLKPLDTRELVCQFAGSALERRVQYLLTQPSSCSLPKYTAVRCWLIVIVAIVSGSRPLHNTLENLLLI